MGVIIEFFKNLVAREPLPASAGTVTVSTEASDFDKFRLTEIALFTAIDLIARTLSKCEFVTVEDNKPVRKSEYYLWNCQPNRHQTKTEFLIEFISKLVFYNEALIFETSDGQLLVADNFAMEKRAVIDDIFSGVTARNFDFGSFRSSDVIYLQYNNFGVTDLLASLCAAYQLLIKDAAEKYEQQAGHKVILGINANPTNDMEFKQQLNNLLEKDFKAFFSKKNAVLPLFRNFTYTEPTTDAKNKATNEISDIKQLRAEAFSAVGNAFHISPAVISGEASMLSEATQALIGNAVDPVADMLSQAITSRRYGEEEYRKGNYLTIDTTRARHIDAVHDAVNIDKAIASGVLSPYRAQKYCNILPVEEDWAKEYYITKNYQSAELALRGGEDE